MVNELSSPRFIVRTTSPEALPCNALLMVMVNAQAEADGDDGECSSCTAETEAKPSRSRMKPNAEADDELAPASSLGIFRGD